MGLQEQLDAFKSEFAKSEFAHTTPPGRPALYEARIEELSASFALEEAVAIGDEAPDFSLPEIRGNSVSLPDLLRRGSVVATRLEPDAILVVLKSLRTA
jgi:hypothetical protein